MVEVSAGIIRQRDGRILVCRRGEGRKNAHLWEFPGGKREAGETAEACLVRELKEELSLEVEGVREICTCEAQGIHFTFLLCETEGTPVLSEHEDARFVRPREMLLLPFCPADTGVAASLALNDPPLRHFFWDFDGTLMDTYPAMTKALVRASAAVGVNLDTPRALNLMKNSLSYAVKTLARESGVAEDKYFDALERENGRMEQGSVKPVRGIPQALAEIRQRGGKHYIVTHRSRSTVDFLEQAGLLGYFEDMVLKEDGFARKPAPDSCLHLLRKHGIDPAQAVMIGDRPLDTAAGRAAGMLSCLLDEENRFPDDPCEIRVNSAAALPEALVPRPLL